MRFKWTAGAEREAPDEEQSGSEPENEPAARAGGASAFSGSRFALVGFDPKESSPMFEALAAMGGLAHPLDPQSDPLIDKMEVYGAVLLNVGATICGSSWASLPNLLALKSPLVAVGSYEELNSCPIIKRNASELLFRPVRPEEMLIRIERCLGKTITALDNSPSRKIRVLIADDDKFIFLLTSAILQSKGIECHHAEDGRQALEMARTILPDLVVLDVNMPFVNGLDIMATLRRDPGTSAMKILLFTGHDGEEFVTRAIRSQSGPDGFLLKPFQPYHFLQRVRGLLPAMNAATHTMALAGS
jgi:CheY-like chemotaxis protein